MSFKQIQDELEKGCRKLIGKFPFGDMPCYCGDGFDTEMCLCLECKAKLEQLKECQALVDEAVKKLRNDYPSTKILGVRVNPQHSCIDYYDLRKAILGEKE